MALHSVKKSTVIICKDNEKKEILTKLCKSMNFEISDISSFDDLLTFISERSNDTTFFQHKSNNMTLSEIEKLYISIILNRCNWECKSAAKQLGINRSTLYRKLKKYGIKRGKKENKR